MKKFGQLIIPMSSDTSMNADMTALIQQYQIGGYFIPEYTATAQQLHDFVNQMQAASKIPMLMVTDLKEAVGTLCAQRLVNGHIPAISALPEIHSLLTKRRSRRPIIEIGWFKRRFCAGGRCTYKSQ